MPSSSPVEIADRKSRKRAWTAAAAALVFLLNSVLRPFLMGGIAPHDYELIDWWAVNAVLVLLILATGGGLLLRRTIRALMNDEIARAHLNLSLVVGFWIAMTTAMGLYLIPPFRDVTARSAIYIIVSASAGIALLWFSYLEIRAHRDV